MQLLSSKLIKTIPLWLILGIVVYIIILFSASFIKYYFYLYNALDLAIFNQIFWNSANGDWFISSINPPSYLGDHFAPLLIALVPLYKLFSSPLTLLFLQTIFLGLAAWPLYLISKQYLSGWWLKLIIFAWLLNPFVHSINLFEFHLISIFPFLLFWLWYFFIKDRFILFIIMLGISLLLREDVALGCIGIALIFLMNKKLNKRFLLYGLSALLISILWFFASTKLISFYNIAGEYKFLTYYSWLGDSWLLMAKNILSNPLLIINKLFTKGTLSIILLVLLPTAFIPLAAPSYLIGGLIPMLPLLLTKLGGNVIALFMHYGMWILPFVFLANLYALHKIKKLKTKITASPLLVLIKNNTGLLFFILISSILYSFVVLSPLIHLSYRVITSPKQYITSKQHKDAVLKLIEPQAHIITTSDFLTELSARKNIYYLRYLFFERYQLSNVRYELANNNKYILFSPKNLMAYQENNSAHPEMGKKLNSILENYKLRAVSDDYLLFDKDKGDTLTYYKEYDNLPPRATRAPQEGDNISFLGWHLKTKSDMTDSCPYLELHTYWKTNKKTKRLQWQIAVENDTGVVFKDVIPPSLGLTSTDKWPSNKIIETVFLLPLPKPSITGRNYNIHMKPVELRGGLVLNKISSSEFVANKIFFNKPEIYLKINLE